MGQVETRLEELGLTLPAPLTPPPGATFNFAPVKVHNGIGYVAGHGPFDGSTPLMQGVVGGDLTVEQGYEAARLCALSMLAAFKETVGDLDRIAGWVRAVGYVNCTPGFPNTFLVVNGFSDLILELWGEAGRHSRSAIGAGELPFGMPVEVEAVVTLG